MLFQMIRKKMLDQKLDLKMKFGCMKKYEKVAILRKGGIEDII